MKKIKSIIVFLITLITCTTVAAIPVGATETKICTDPSILSTFTDGFTDKNISDDIDRIDTFINGNFYPATGIVVTIAHGSEYEDITIEHANGNLFKFTAPATDCWELGDLASCIMDSNGTPDSVYDDKVLSAWYCGSPEQFTSIMH